MPPKFKVTKEAVLDAAFTLLDTRGYDAVTTRAIAEALGISSRPIYSYFPSMESLFEALLTKSVSVMKDYMSRSYSRDPFLNSGVGYVRFALDRRNVSDFIELNWSEPSSLELDADMVDELYAKTQENSEYKGITREAFLDIYQNTSIYTYGLVAYARATKTELSEQETIEKLYKAGEAFVVQYLWSLDKQTRIGDHKEISKRYQ